MSKKFDEIVNEALTVERELRKLSADKLSIRGWVSACLGPYDVLLRDPARFLYIHCAVT